MTLEEAAEKVARLLFGKTAWMQENARRWSEDERLISALRAYGDQRFIEGAAAMREALLVDPVMWEPHRNRIRSIDINQLKDTDHG